MCGRQNIVLVDKWPSAEVRELSLNAKANLFRAISQKRHERHLPNKSVDSAQDKKVAQRRSTAVFGNPVSSALSKRVITKRVSETFCNWDGFLPNCCGWVFCCLSRQIVWFPLDPLNCQPLKFDFRSIWYFAAYHKTGFLKGSLSRFLHCSSWEVLSTHPRPLQPTGMPESWCNHTQFPENLHIRPISAATLVQHFVHCPCCYLGNWFEHLPDCLKQESVVADAQI